MVGIALWTVASLPQAGKPPADPPWKSSYSRVITHPTGANGYEEYLKASDMVANPVANKFLTYEMYLQQVEAGQTPDSIPPLPSGVTPEMTLLDVQREHVRRCSAAIDMLERGNGKQVFEPRDKMDVNTLFPEFAGMKQLAKFAITDMRVCFADGQPSRATSIATSMLTMRGKLPPSTLICELVGIAMDSIMLGGVSDNLEHFSERDWEKMIPFAEARLAYCPLTDVMKSEMQFQIQTAELIRKGNVFSAQDIGAIDDANSQSIATAYNNLSQAQRDRLTDSVQSSIRRTFNELLQRFTGPEASWVPPPVPDQPAVKYDGTLAGLTASFTDMMLPVFDGAITAEVKDRVQLRLLKLHALIQIYRWHHGHLPEKLEQAAPKDAVDPLIGEPYIYEPGPIGYKLASKGLPQTGEIQLRYTRPKNLQSDPSDPPPSR